jgi:hypothetical protein
MTGGIIQLVAVGREDLFLTRDPQITFFKILYRRHTNFTREEVEQHFTHDPNFGQTYTSILATDGDMIDGLSMKIVLPRIPIFQIAGGTDTLTKFAWARRIGHVLIKSVSIEINGKVIDKHFGEWLHIISTLTTVNIDDGGFDKMIGNVPELYEFSNGKEEYTLYIPLYFWFCRATGLALPLIALQYCDVKINVEINDFNSCHLITPTHYIQCTDDFVNYKENEFLSQKGPDGVERYAMFTQYDIDNKRLYYFSIGNDRLIGVPYSGDITLLTDAERQQILSTPLSQRYVITGESTINIAQPNLGVKSITHRFRQLRSITIKNCVLLVSYVYLDIDERYSIAQTKQDYLIEQLYFTPSIQIEGTNRKVKLNIDQPCKFMVWICQFDYIVIAKDYFNFTNSHIRRRTYDTPSLSNVIYPTKIKQYNDVQFEEPVGTALIEDCEIQLNSKTRQQRQSKTYFEHMQPYQHGANRAPNGCLMYSYSLFPFDVQPSGTTNMSQIELIELHMKMNFRIDISKKIKLRGYSIVYNVWRVNHGVSAEVFTR